MNNHLDVNLRHLNFGGALTAVQFRKLQLRCPHCGTTAMQEVPFKAEHHRITKELYTYVEDLLTLGKYTNRQVGQITGLDENTVKAIDKRRLEKKYTVNGKKLILPEATTPILGIDEFKLHNGYKYATHIIDMQTGHILWISHGKRKQVVYDFIDHVGLDWMERVEAVACDMNSDFQEAREGKVISKGSELFCKEEVVRKDDHMEKYEAIIEQNKLLFTADLIKEKLADAYGKDNEPEMAKAMTEIMELCSATDNRHY